VQQLGAQTSHIYENQPNSQSRGQGSVGQHTFTPNNANTPGRTQAFDTNIFKGALPEREKAFNTWRQATAPNMAEGDRALLSKLVSFSGQEQGGDTKFKELMNAVSLAVQKYGANVHKLVAQLNLPQDIERKLQHLSVNGPAGEAARYIGTMADERNLNHIDQIVEAYGLSSSDDINKDGNVPPSPSQRISAIYHIAIAMKKSNISGGQDLLNLINNLPS
jgi:hypothetical protein